MNTLDDVSLISCSWESTASWFFPLCSFVSFLNMSTCSPFLRPMNVIFTKPFLLTVTCRERPNCSIVWIAVCIVAVRPELWPDCWYLLPARYSALLTQLRLPRTVQTGGRTAALRSPAHQSQSNSRARVETILKSDQRTIFLKNMFVSSTG